MILCIRIPYFTTNILFHKSPSSTPLALVRRHKVVGSNAVAVQADVVPGLTQRQALALLPDLVLVAEDLVYQDQIVNHILDMLSTFTPLVECAAPVTKRSHLPPMPDPDQAALFYVDLEPLNVADSQQVGGQIRQSIQAMELQAMLGLADGKFSAWVAARHTTPTTTRTIPTERTAAFFAPLPVDLLPADSETLNHLHGLGLTTLGQIANLTLYELLSQLGKQGFVLYRLARGQGDWHVIPHRFEIVEQVTCEVDTPLNSPDQIEAILLTMAAELSFRLQAKGAMGRILTLTLHFTDHSTLKYQGTLRQAASGTTAISQQLVLLLGQVKTLPNGVGAIEVTCSQIVPFAGQQLDLFSHHPDQEDRLKATLGNLTLRYDANCFLWIKPAPRTTRRIERRYE